MPIKATSQRTNNMARTSSVADTIATPRRPTSPEGVRPVATTLTTSGDRMRLASARLSLELHTHGPTRSLRCWFGDSHNYRTVRPPPAHARLLGRALKRCAAPESKGLLPYCAGRSLTTSKPLPNNVTTDVEAMCSRTRLSGARSDAQRPGKLSSDDDD